MCSLYDLFRCRDWGWESVLQAGCTLHESRCLSALPTVILYANEFSAFMRITSLCTILTARVASWVWMWHTFSIFSRLQIQKTLKRSHGPTWENYLTEMKLFSSEISRWAAFNQTKAWSRLKHSEAVTLQAPLLHIASSLLSQTHESKRNELVTHRSDKCFKSLCNHTACRVSKA